MNKFLQKSIDYANGSSYLDELYSVYPTIIEGNRVIDETIWRGVETAFGKRDNNTLIKELLKLELFPIKDSYVAFLKHNKTAVENNPDTVDRLCERIYELGIDKLHEVCSEPKESNRKIGPFFRQWLRKGALGVVPVDIDTFTATEDNAVLDGSDNVLKDFAHHVLHYEREKGLDLVARFNGQYVIGEAKFLTDFGGHQNAQFEDAISTLNADVNAIKVAILDGVLYLNRKNKMHRSVVERYSNCNIMSALVLREFLEQL